MKKFLFISMLVFSIPVMAQIKSASLTASGLTCSMCSKAIYKSLSQVPTVKTVQVDIKNSRYNIQFKEDVTVKLDDIKKAVADAGFAVASMQVTANFNNVEIANDTHIVLAGSNFHFLAVTKQILNGDKTFTIVDKNYLSPATFKKYSKYSTMKCVETGMMESCCAKNGSTNNRIYHITL